MEQERAGLVSPTSEVPVIEGELVTAIRELTDRGWGSKTIARELQVARNTVRRYVRGAAVGVQVRPTARRLSEDDIIKAQTLFQGAAEGNAVVVQRLLRDAGCLVSVRTIQRLVAPIRQAQRAADVATLRVETSPGAQMQVDFGENASRSPAPPSRCFSSSRSSVIPAACS
jgi:transposase